MASSIFKPSRIIAVLILLGAAGWIASGALAPGADDTHVEVVETPEEPVAAVPLQKVSVAPAVPESHQRRITLSCTTEADHSSVAVSRTNGIITALDVARGDKVRDGQTIATLSDEGRQAAVLQAQALLDQRIAEYDANKALIDKGQAPKNQLPALEAAVAAARAALAAAEAEADKGTIRSPIAGIVQEVPVQVGQAVQPGAQIASIVDPDPMLAVGAVSERERSSVRLDQPATMRFIDGVTKTGTITYVGVSADKATRTYPVQARMDNPDALIGDGVTCEMVVETDPIEAVSVPRSALVFADDGGLGIRVVDAESKAQFIPVVIVDDGVDSVWVSGISDPIRVIVVGQDFVKDGDQVEAVLFANAPTDEPPA
ncbi:MAG: efflux RND transporter periplasmic adaptor subunit [Bauldia sp.]|nr:efflux RND transporter periplasmic adaptor subunit [Bauldia sp.]